MPAQRHTPPGVVNRFGGDWTKEKLRVLKQYLEAYARIFAKNKRAQFYETFYVDAFAGSGYIRTSGQKKASDQEQELFSDIAAPDAAEFLKRSAVCALEVEPGFKNYLFVEKSAARCKELKSLRAHFPERREKVQIVSGDANKELIKWIHSRDWNKTRAVVFLDPYGMQVEWSTIESLGQTQGVDLWFLFPLGIGVMRLLTTKSKPPTAWAEKLDRIFGSQEWHQEFYRPTMQSELFNEFQSVNGRSVDYAGVIEYIKKRLAEAFCQVHQEPKLLLNSTNNPLFVLFFAAANEKGAKVAMKIAGDLMRI